MSLPLNQIICGDCLEVMKAFPDESIDLVVTSPPYNVGKDYGSGREKDKIPFTEYHDFAFAVTKEIKRLLIVGGRFCIEIGGSGRNFPLSWCWQDVAYKSGLGLYSEITIPHRKTNPTAWGSWMKPNNVFTIPNFHLAYVFFKATETKKGEGIDIRKDEFVEWTFRTPTAEDLVHINSKCPVRFKVSYSFDAISEMEVDVISKAKYDQLQQSGEFQTFVPTLSLGRGPLRIILEFGASQPIKTDTTLPIYVTVEDKGTGLYATIPDGALNLTVPAGFSLEGCGDRFGCTGSTCSNSGNIMMIEKKSPTFRCSLRTPSEGTVAFEKVYIIESGLHYTYDITKQVDVDIKALI